MCHEIANLELHLPRLGGLYRKRKQRGTVSYGYSRYARCVGLIRYGFEDSDILSDLPMQLTGRTRKEVQSDQPTSSVQASTACRAIAFVR
jgi:hypothetical protein